mgnify:FL=1
MQVVSGLGTGAYGLSQFGYPADEPETLAPAPNASARKIDGKTKRYVLNSDGGFDAMDGTAQRVLLLTSFATADRPEFIDERSEAQTQQRILEGLAPLLDTRDPDIALKEAAVTDDGRDTTHESVIYKNLRPSTLERKLPR